MESVNKKVIALSLIMAILTSALVYIYIKKVTTKADVVEYINVYAAAKTLPPRHKISSEDIKVVKVTREYLNSKAILNSAEIIGKYLQDSIIEGEQILRDRLVDERKLDLVYKVPKGKRAVSVNVNEQIEVANLLNPGDFVDVIASFEQEDIEVNQLKIVNPRVSKIIIQNVMVLALGQEQYTGGDKAKELPKTLTLAVEPLDAEKLVYASEFGVIRLALRNVEDDRLIDTQGTVRSDMIGDKGARVVEK